MLVEQFVDQEREVSTGEFHWVIWHGRQAQEWEQDSGL